MSPLDADFAWKKIAERLPADVLPGLSRRQFLHRGVGGAAAMAVATAGADTASAFERRVSRKLVRSPARQVFDPTLRTLINRTTFGFTRDAYEEAAQLGFDAYVESQLDYESIDDSALEARLAAYDTLSMTSQEIYDTYQGMQNVPSLQLMEATVLRAVLSKRQLYERMVQFWTDHFNIDIRKGLSPYFKTADDRDVIRRYAMSSFSELLNASARSAAMLFYLDNYANIVGHAQENYARELMELHTLGVDGGYTQQDVEEVARCFTGWTIQNTPNLGEFLFYAPYHDNGAKTVLGVSIPSGGWQNDGQVVLDLLANHPNTARFIARKLCVRFLGYDPPEDIVESVKSAYLATGGDIRSMLRVILREAVMAYLTTPKLKRPFHMATSLLRATDATITGPLYVVYYTMIMGHGPFLWSPPDGYPDTLEAWGTSVLPRWQFASALLEGFIPDVSVDPLALMNSEGQVNPGEEAAAIDRILSGDALSDAEVAELQAFYDSAGALATRDSFELAASLAGFQWY